MKLIPFENITYKTKLSTSEVSDLLNASIRESKIKGNVNKNTFKVTRVINYQNSFLPVCKGVITSKGLNESNIKVNMKPNTFVLVFMSFWIMFTSIIGITLLFISEFGVHNLAPFFMLILGCLITVLGFNFESKKIKIIFNELFNPIKTNGPISRN